MERMQATIRNWLVLLTLVLVAPWAMADEEAQASTGLYFYQPSGFGPNAVGHDSYEITDPDRDGRKLLIDIWYPVRPADIGDEPVTSYVLFPGFELPAHIAREDVPVSPRLFRKLVVFSHGSGSFSAQSTLLTETLASHGYIVVAPNHTGNTAFGPRDPLEVAAVNRPLDVSFVIDHMLERSAAPGDDFYQRVDPDDVGVTGHSFGGFTAMAMAAGFGPVPPDPRVRAIAPISGAFEDLFTPAELAGVDIPVLLLGGTADDVVPISNNDYAFVNLPGKKPVHQVDLIGAIHSQFAGVCEMGQSLIDNGLPFKEWIENPITAALIPYYLEACVDAELDIAEVQRMQNQFVVSFFRRYLSDGGFWNSRIYGVFLFPDWIDRVEPAADAWRRSALDPFGLWY